MSSNENGEHLSRAGEGFPDGITPYSGACYEAGNDCDVRNELRRAEVLRLFLADDHTSLQPCGMPVNGSGGEVPHWRPFWVCFASRPSCVGHFAPNRSFRFILKQTLRPPSLPDDIFNGACGLLISKLPATAI